MAIYKAKIESNFAVIPNATLQDKQLSYEATGLLAMMLSLPDDWAIHKSWLQDQKVKCGRDKLTGIMNELVDAGYVRRQVKQTDGGKLDGVDWLVYPEPTVSLENRKTDKPSDGKSDTTKETVIQKKQNTNSLTPAEPKRSKFKYSPDDMSCAEWIRQRVEMVNPAAPKANLESWANTIRLMREMDEKSHREILEVFKWANLDSFWCNNIQSPEKLRKQFGNLKGRMNNAANQPATNATGNRRLTAEEERNQELLRKYGHTTAPTERTINTDEHSGLDQRQVQRGISEQVEQEGVTIDLDSGDWSSYGQSDS